MFKKTVLLFSIFSIFLCSLFSQDLTGQRVLIFHRYENIGPEDADWVGGYVADRLQANIDKYLDCIFVNAENEAEINALQTKFEEDSYDETLSLDSGKLLNAKYAIIVTIRKAGSNYKVSAKVTDIEEGVDIAITEQYEEDDSESLADTYGCAVDRLTIDLLEKLNVTLTVTDKHILMNGEAGLSEDEKIKKYAEDARRYQAQLDEINQSINILKDSADVDAEVKQANLEAEREVASEKLKWVRSKQEKLQKEADKKRQDAIDDEMRGEELRNRLHSTSQKLAEKVATVTLLQHKSFMGTIKRIEATKKAFQDIKTDATYQQQVIEEELKEQVKNKQEELETRPLKTYEMSNGKITHTARQNRIDELRSFEKELRSQADLRIANIDQIAEDQQTELLKKIHKEYDSIEKVTITTMGEELIVEIGEFDGERYGWPLTITVQSDDIIVLATKSFLQFEQVAGYKQAPHATDKNHLKYEDDVEFYTIMFNRYEPLFTFALDVFITPMGNDQPSKYNFSFENFRFYDTLKYKTNGKTIRSSPQAKLNLMFSNINHQMVPAYDIRTKSDFEKEEKEAQALAHIEEKADAKREKEIRERKIKQHKEQEKKRKAAYEKATREFHRNMIGVNWSFNPREMKNSSLGLEFSKGIASWFYFDYNVDFFNIMNVPSKYYPFEDPTLNPLLTNFFQFGINIHFGQKVQIFGSGGAGFNLSFPKTFFSEFFTESNKAAYFKQNCKFDGTYGWQAGMTLELIRHMAINASYKQTYLMPKKYMYDTVNVGLGFMF